MLYLEELLDAVIAEEGQTLMGLEFLVETLNLSMKKIDFSPSPTALTPHQGPLPTN